MDIKQWVEKVARELIIEQAKQLSTKPKILHIFCDSTAHEAFLDYFITLQNHDIAHDILFLDGETSAWLGMHKIESGGAGRLITADEYAPAPIELPKEYDAVVIPEIDLDNASRIATGMKGTVKSDIVFSALVLNKLVVMGEDVPGIKRSDRKCLQTVSLPLPYQKLFQQYVQQLKELGIVFSTQMDLAETVIHSIREVVPLNMHAGLQGGDDTPSENNSVFQRKLLSANDVLSANDGQGRIRLKKGTIISPLAKDVLKERGIQVQYT